MIAVPEHITNPKSALASYVRLLNEDGALVIAVPHLTRLAIFVAGASSPVVAPPLHVSLFNRDNLSQLLAALGPFQSLDLLESGPPAFEISQHVPFAEHFDITIPAETDVTPRTVMRQRYSEEQMQQVSALTTARQKMAGTFAGSDGRLILTAIARKAPQPSR